MAVTTEVSVHTTGRSRSTEITDQQWVDGLDMIEPAKTPLLSFADNEISLGDKEFKKNVDTLGGPKGALGRADAEAAPGSGSTLSEDATTGVRLIGNIAQGFSRTWRSGWISQRLNNIHGFSLTDGALKTRFYKLLKLDQEVAIGSFDQPAILDQGGGLGALGAGYHNLVCSANRYTSVSAFGMGKATDLHYAPSGAVLTGALSASHSRSMWMDVAYALRVAAQQDHDWMLLAGLNLNQKISDLTNPTTATITGQASSVARAADQVRVYLRNETDSVLGVAIDTIHTPNGRIFVAKSDWLGTTTPATSAVAATAFQNTTAGRASASFSALANAGILLQKGNLFKMWGITPFVEELGATGAGADRDTKCLMAWGVRNPILAGSLYFTS